MSLTFVVAMEPPLPEFRPVEELAHLHRAVWEASRSLGALETFDGHALAGLKRPWDGEGAMLMTWEAMRLLVHGAVGKEREMAMRADGSWTMHAVGFKAQVTSV